MPLVHGIYCFKNEYNGKRYIGQSIDVYGRKSAHLRKLKNGVHPNGYLQASFLKYGADAFVFSVLEVTTVNVLDAREIAWIQFYRSNELGYNLASGGQACRHSESTKLKIGLAHRGKTISKRHRLALRKARSGSVATDATRAKMSAAHKGRKFTESHKRAIAQSRIGKQFPRSKS